MVPPQGGGCGDGLELLRRALLRPGDRALYGVDAVGVQDSNLHSFNRYAYGNGNPFRYIDPDGRLPILIPIVVAIVAEALNLGFEAHDNVSNPCGDCARSSGFGIPGPPVGRALGKVEQVGKSGLGDLTKAEVKQIQKQVDEAGRPLDVVGSAARGDRRNPGSNLPFGKGGGTKSDIDFLTHPQNLPAFKGKQGKLPEIDPKTGIIPGAHNPFQGPGIRFEPGVAPKLNPATN